MTKAIVEQRRFDLPEINDNRFSVKSDLLARAVLGKQIRTVYKRCFEGALAKITSVDIDALIKDDKPLVVNLTQDEYRSRFPRESRLKKIFTETALYYTKNTTIEVWLESGGSEKELESAKFINVVDSAEVMGDGSLEIMFTRSVMPYMKEIKDRLLVTNLEEFSDLTGKYSQKLYDIAGSCILNDAINYQIEIGALRKELSIPQSYTTSKFIKTIIKDAADEINEKTSFDIEFTALRGEFGKSLKYIIFTFRKIKDDAGDEVEPYTGVAINTFSDHGLTYKNFKTILALRAEKSKPIIQASMDYFLGEVLEVSKLKETIGFEEIIKKIIMNGWVSTVDKNWYLVEKRDKKAPKKETGEKKDKKPESVDEDVARAEKEARDRVLYEKAKRSVPNGLTSPTDLLNAENRELFNTKEEK